MSHIENVPTSAPVSIALVTADERVADRVATALDPLGRVEVMSGARLALGRTHDGDFDVVVVDLEIRQGTGLVRCLSSLDGHLPVVALTTSLDDASDVDAPLVHRDLAAGAMLRVAVARAVRAAERATHRIAV